MDLNTPNTNVTISVTETDEVRINATNVHVTVTPTGRVLGGLVFNIGGSRLTIEDGGVVQRGLGGPADLAILGSAGNDTVINNGAINGRVELGDGADSFSSTTGVAQQVDLGAGDDTLSLTGSLISQFTGLGGSGYDRLVLTDTSFGSSAISFSGFEEIRVVGASVGGNVQGQRNTSLFGLSGVQLLEVVGDPAGDPFSNSPAIYVRNSAIATANVTITGRAGLYLDNSHVDRVTGDAAANFLTLWTNSSVVSAIDLAGGDDFLSIEWQTTNATPALPATIAGGAGQDWLSLRLVNGGAATVDFATITGFERITLQTPTNVAGLFNLSNLSTQTSLAAAGQATVNISASNATGLVVESLVGTLNLAAGSTILRFGAEFPNPGNASPNPALSVTLVNAGTILGSVRFEQGDDTYNGTAGTVGGPVDGGAGNDTLLGGAAAETMRGGAGVDRLEGNGGGDILFGDAGNDSLLGGDGNDQLFGGGGADVLDGGAGFDYVSYGDAAGGVLADLVVWELNTGEAAGDSYAAVEGLVGSAFADSLRGTGGDNWIYGGGGADAVFGRGGSDVLIGEAGDDTLYGNEGDDWLYGGDGIDRLIGGSGADYFNGGDGFDFVYYDDATSGVTVNLGNSALNRAAASGDLLFNIEGVVGTAFNDNLYGDANDNWLYGNDGIDSLDGSDGNDVLIAGNGNDRVFGGEGADLLYGEGGNDWLVAGNGADWLSGGQGDDVLAGEAGNDIMLGGDGADQLTGGTGGDQLDGGAGLDFARYDNAADSVIVDLVVWANNTGDAQGDSFAAIEGLVGSAFADSLRGDAAGNVFYGELGEDWLFGRGGDDTLLGGGGNDTLFGNEGTDLLYGNAGSDRFFFGSGDGNDVIADFEGGAGAVIDTIHIAAAFGITSFAQLQSRIAQVGNDTVITFDAGHSITLVGIAATSLLADDFVFG